MMRIEVITESWEGSERKLRIWETRGADWVRVNDEDWTEQDFEKEPVVLAALTVLRATLENEQQR